jgi:ketosteroid isomerase-like protein
MSLQTENIEIVKAYFRALDRSSDELVNFYHADVVQEEFPNRFLPNGARRDLGELREAAERGRKVMTSQRFEVLSMFADGDTVAVECDWFGTLAVPLGDATPAGSVMRARFAQFFVIDGGKIVAQRNYDCFYPW